MNINQQRAAILHTLRAPPACRFEQGGVWDTIVAARREAEEHKRLLLYIYRLGIIFAHCTGTMPGYSKGDNETRFERFVMSVPQPQGIPMTRGLVKSATKQLDAKNNATFLGELQVLRGKYAAE